MQRKQRWLKGGLALGVAMAMTCAAPVLALGETELVEEPAPIVASGAAGDEGLSEEGPSLEAQEGEKSGVCGTCSWSIGSDGTLVIRPTNGTEGTLADDSKSGWAWNKWGTSDSVRSVRFEGTVHARSCRNLFNLGKAETINLRGLDTSQVTDMYYMFASCYALKSIDLRPLNTSRVTNMHGMFYFCSRLTEINFTGFDTSQVTDMGDMFDEAYDIAVFDFTSFDTSKATDMTHMFGGEIPHRIREFKVGDKYDIGKEGAFPISNPWSEFSWWSIKLGKWLDYKEIIQNRNRVADTYLSYKPEGADKTFPDVATGTWYADVVGRAAGLGLINGYKDGRFGPADNVTRGQVAVILWNMAGKPAAGSGARTFPDVRAGAYYYDAVRWASSAGVVSGYSNGRFGPNDNVTREQLAAMLANYAHGKGSAADYGSMGDAGRVSPWARSAVGWCFRNKIISGTKDGRVNPQGNATRAETAKMVVFLHDLIS